MKNEQDNIRQCPRCKRNVLWDNMIWLNGECTCPECYMQKRAEEDRKRGRK